jgi:hypothetical protein
MSAFSRRSFRLVWLGWVLTLIVAGVLYANKAAEQRSAFVRWRHQVHEFWQGKNIWDRYIFPNPPIMPITLSPLMAMPPVAGAVAWFAIKAVMATLAMAWCFRMARGPDGTPLPPWCQGLVMLLSLRMFLSDLHHGNINLLILFLVVATLMAWRQGYDVLAGLALALAITFKVTPALFVPYFLFKRSWRTVGSTLLGLALFFVIVPSAVLGPEFNGQCLAMWWQRMLSPFVMGDDISPQEMNQSLGGVVTRLLVEHPRQQTEHGYGGVRYPVNIASWPRDDITLVVKFVSVGMVGLLAWLSRTQTKRRDDPRMLGEFALVVLTMLFVSERTWKHHYVTLLLPYTYLVYQGFVAPPPGDRRRWFVAAALGFSSLLIGSTSREAGRLFAGGHGHEFALSMGMFFWGGVVIYGATAWLVHRQRLGTSDATVTAREAAPRPHLAAPPRALPSARS